MPAILNKLLLTKVLIYSIEGIYSINELTLARLGF